MSLSFLKNKQLIAGGLILFLLACGAYVGISPYYQGQDRAYDDTLRKTLSSIADVYAYTQYVETEAVVSDRNIRVVGDYYINGRDSLFASVATTTLRIPGTNSETHSFTLKNISTENDVYTKIETDSELLLSTIPHSRKWRHFKKDAIPREFSGIAISGPILDNLLLFQHDGAYLLPVNVPGKETWGDESLIHYTFKLSARALKHAGGTLRTLVDRIGEEGRIEVWIDEEAAQLRHFVFEGNTYRSTTTISAINNLRVITPPLPQETDRLSP